jgi:hypothetical protein
MAPHEKLMENDLWGEIRAYEKFFDNVEVEFMQICATIEITMFKFIY